MDAGDEVLASARSDRGMARVRPLPDAYEAALLGLVEPWLAPASAPGPATDVLACGMLGSRQGWVETPYRPAPTRVEPEPGLTAAPAADPRLRVQVAAGVSQASPPDVIRGEETMILGLLAAEPDLAGTVIVPGTHSKWITVADGAITRFTTFMTGELYGLLSGHSVLRHSVATRGLDRAAFLAGYDDTLARPASLAASLFALRARDLLGAADPVAAASRLSGGLLGLEVAGARPGLGAGPITLVAGEPLASRYRLALETSGIGVRVRDPDSCVLAGLVRLRRAGAEYRPC